MKKQTFFKKAKSELELLKKIEDMSSYLESFPTELTVDDSKNIRQHIKGQLDFIKQAINQYNTSFQMRMHYSSTLTQLITHDYQKSLSVRDVQDIIKEAKTNTETALKLAGDVDTEQGAANHLMAITILAALNTDYNEHFNKAETENNLKAAALIIQSTLDDKRFFAAPKNSFFLKQVLIDQKVGISLHQKQYTLAAETLKTNIKSYSTMMPEQFEFRCQQLTSDSNSTSIKSTCDQLLKEAATNVVVPALTR